MRGQPVSEKRLSPAARAKAMAQLGKLEKQMDWDGMMTEARRVIALDPGHHPLYEMLVTALMQSGEVGPAIAASRRLMAISPRDPRYRMNLATLLHVAGNLGESAQQFDNVVNLFPDSQFVEEAMGHIENLDRMQTQQILLLAAEQEEFRWGLERNLAGTLEVHGFCLSQHGYDTLRQMIPGTDEELEEAPTRWH